MNNLKIYLYLIFSFLYYSERVPAWGTESDEGAASGMVRATGAMEDRVEDAQDRPKKRDITVGQKTYGQIDLQHALLGEWISLEMMSLAEIQGLTMHGDSGLGSAMQQYNVTPCTKLPPYAPWGPVRVEGLRGFLEEDIATQLTRKIPHALRALLLQIDPAHAFQLFMYPAVWKIDSGVASSLNIQMIPLVLARPYRMTDAIIDTKTFLEAYSLSFFKKMAHYLKQLSLQKQIIPLFPGMPPRVAGYLGQFLAMQPHAATYLTQRDNAIRLLLEKDKNTVHSQFLLGQRYKSLGMVAEAATIFHKLWHEGSALAAFDYAMLDGRESGISLQNQLKAFQFSAHRGLPIAQFHWAMKILNNFEPFPDYESVRVFLERAADQGVPQAMMELGYDLARGRGGPKDLPRAATLFEMAGSEGVRNGYLEAGKLAYKEGTEAGYARARKLYALALEGDPDNRSIRNQLAILWAKGWGGRR